MRKVGFDKATIVELKVRRLVSEDKSMRLTLQVDNPDDDLINDLNRIFKAGGHRVAVGIAESK